ncbi:transposase [Streptomyces sp. NPDC058316]|uniref:transposase n=1 Tax=unclassified Streptomyces TaxID=2593676 RepID=UPI0036E2AC82
MIRRHELSDAEREFVRPLLPRSLRGRKRLDYRTVLNATVWKFRTGTAWRDVPERYGAWATPHGAPAGTVSIKITVTGDKLAEDCTETVREVRSDPVMSVSGGATTTGTRVRASMSVVDAILPAWTS